MRPASLDRIGVRSIKPRSSSLATRSRSACGRNRPESGAATRLRAEMRRRRAFFGRGPCPADQRARVRSLDRDRQVESSPAVRPLPGQIRRRALKSAAASAPPASPVASMTTSQGQRPVASSVSSGIKFSDARPREGAGRCARAARRRRQALRRPGSRRRRKTFSAAEFLAARGAATPPRGRRAAAAAPPQRRWDPGPRRGCSSIRPSLRPYLHLASGQARIRPGNRATFGRLVAVGIFAMTFPLTLLNLAGAIALLLWGSHMVQTGVQRAFGPKLRSFLGTALRNRFKGFLRRTRRHDAAAEQHRDRPDGHGFRRHRPGRSRPGPGDHARRQCRHHSSSSRSCPSMSPRCRRR